MAIAASFSASKELCFYCECCDGRGLCSRPQQYVGWNADIAPRTPAPVFHKLFNRASTAAEIWSCDTYFYLLAPRSSQDYESTPSKQDYMNTLKESVLLTQGDARVLPLRTSPGGCV